MNFLAHAVLAGNNPGVVAGSLAGDFVKGIVRDDDYPADFLLGIRLHRRLDAFSNQEPWLRTSAARLPTSLRRIAPPCIDMAADHFLAQAANATPDAYLGEIDGAPGSAVGLQRFEDALHELITVRDTLLTEDARRFFAHAKTTRLFSDYADFERTARGIHHVCLRLRRPDEGPVMAEAVRAQHTKLQADFTHYWPALVAEAQRFLAEASSETDGQPGR